MKIRLLKCGLLFLIFIPWDARTQQKLSKDEILSYYQTNRVMPDIDSAFRWDIHSTTRVLFDSLIQSDVDTLVVYLVSYPGSVYVGKRDSCWNGYAINSYFFWKEKGKYLYLDTDGLCKSLIRNADGKVIDFAVSNYWKIDSEFFMDAVTGAERKGKDIRVKINLVDHEPKYSMLIVVGERSNYLTFTEKALTDKSSLFVGYNKGLISFRLFELIKTQIESD